MLEPIIRDGETYALPQTMTREEALAYWHAKPNRVYVAEQDGATVGTYLLRTNQAGGGAHVANCGYVTAQHAQGRGVARVMCMHSLDEARALGYRAMQFNFVVSTNARAVRLWQSCGFEVVGTLPEAFRHPQFGYVDAFVMWRDLVAHERRAD